MKLFLKKINLTIPLYSTRTLQVKNISQTFTLHGKK